MGTANVYENAYLDAGLGSGHAAGFPATVYLGLYSAAPNDTGGGTELSGSGYARAAVTNNSTNWPNASGGSKSNGAAIAFPIATADWATATHFGIFDASSGGNLIHYGALSTPRTILAGQQGVFNPGNIVVTAD